MTKFDYRKNKTQMLGLYLSDEDAKLVQAAIDKAAKNIGCTNNRKNRLALIEICKHYLNGA